MRLLRCVGLTGVILATSVLIANAGFGDELRESETLFGGEHASDEYLLEYESYLRLMLAEAYAANVRNRMVALPALSNEWTVGLRVGDRGQWEVFALKPSVTARAYSGMVNTRREIERKRSLGASAPELRELEASLRDDERNLPKDPRQVPIERCKADLADIVAAHVQAVWAIVLRGAAKKDAPALPYVRVIADGTSYHFWQAHQSLGAKVNNPESEWPSGKLVSLGFALRAYCQRPDRSTEQQVLSAAVEILPIQF